MELTERLAREQEKKRNLYAPLQEQPLDLDEIFEVMIDSIRYQYVGFAGRERRFTPSEYRTYILSHYRYNTLTVQMLARALRQFASDMHDRRLRFDCDDWVDYRNEEPRFRVRAQADCLWVTEAERETGLQPGDRILTLNRLSPEKIRRLLRYNGLYSTEPERELWDDYLRMAEHAEVLRADGSRETVSLRHFPEAGPRYAIALDRPAANTLRLRLEWLDREAVAALVRENEAEFAHCERLILDLRRCAGGEPEAVFPLLPWLLDREATWEALLADEGSYVNCTARNCELRYRVLRDYEAQLTEPEALAALREERAFYLENYGKGLVYKPPLPAEPLSFRPAAHTPSRVVVLTDTRCENEGEELAALCRRCGERVVTLGRPTMGSLDCFDPITVSLNEHMRLRYPIAMTKAAFEGRGVADKGLPVDIYIPWTPEELGRDRLLEAALEV